MKDLGDGVFLESFNQDPPMLFYGKIDGWWYALHWCRDDWVFVVDAKLEKTLLWIHMPDLKIRTPWSKLSVQFQRYSSLGQGRRPTETAELIDVMKEVIRGCAKEFRESIGPREWSPGWPRLEGCENG